MSGQLSLRRLTTSRGLSQQQTQASQTAKSGVSPMSPTPHCTMVLSTAMHMSSKFIVRALLVSSLLPTTPVAAVRKTRLTWVNGIAYTLKHMEASKGVISSLFGNKPVIYCHNPTAMSHDDDLVGYLGDLTQAGTQKLGRITAEVDNLVRYAFV